LLLPRFIPGTDVNNNNKITISSGERGLKSKSKYEVDATPYNEVYQNLDLTTLDEFKNLNVHNISEMMQPSPLLIC
jgi:hypothetical protein